MYRFAFMTIVTFSAMLGSIANAADPPADRVLAMYFHRTERCPTCKMMGAYSEEAVKTGFADKLKDGTVEYRYIDYEKKENAELAKAYKVAGPALIVAKIEDKKVAKYKDLKDIWTKVREKPEFIKYVQENVKAFTQ
ncbi:nitrophenyl compound nitroreductase subunit ArsF family protein [Novipirellula artificiosorum]|uniref:Thioredoxin domain-containing protein n=1 Tax=Novipirellula artificiosorum TaxID=2528016 RepID=A0A5C6DT53_9BACT|nr:nitrophenyl compound nitroreductase subunit ArsF family protein [Novipirellula artificiosorum]TWU38206.1 hypothetical protein Poly41_26820 [Novipirellula artificiosorum]